MKSVGTQSFDTEAGVKTRKTGALSEPKLAKQIASTIPQNWVRGDCMRRGQKIEKPLALPVQTVRFANQNVTGHFQLKVREDNEHAVVKRYANDLTAGQRVELEVDNPTRKHYQYLSRTICPGDLLR